MEQVDGNALAGPLEAYYGDDMTMATGTCAGCGAAARVAELRVYATAIGSVARCPSCGDVVLVVVEARGEVTVTTEGFRGLP